MGLDAHHREVFEQPWHCQDAKRAPCPCSTPAFASRILRPGSDRVAAEWPGPLPHKSDPKQLASVQCGDRLGLNTLNAFWTCERALRRWHQRQHKAGSCAAL